jgi:hypothetical protein
VKQTRTLTCPYTGQQYTVKEFPVNPASQKPNHGRELDADEESSLPHQGVDTLEFRPSDAGAEDFDTNPL